MSRYNEFHTFQFDDAGAVVAMFEVEGRKTRREKIAGSTFETTTDVNDLGLSAVVEVTQTRVSRGITETTVYQDQDGDTRFDEVFEIEVTGSTASPRSLELQKFGFDLDGNVTEVLEFSRGRWKMDRIDADEDYQLVTLDDGTEYVLKTEQERDGVEFEIYRDGDQNGIWTQIAEGETAGLYLDPIDGSIDLVGVVTDFLGDAILG